MFGNPKKYTTTDLKKDFISGAFQGGMIGLCWGLVYGPYLKYDSNIPFRAFTRNWMRMTATSGIAFMPVVGTTSVLYKFCKSADMTTGPSLLLTVGVTSFMFEAARRLINRIK